MATQTIRLCSCLDPELYKDQAPVDIIIFDPPYLEKTQSYTQNICKIKNHKKREYPKFVIEDWKQLLPIAQKLLKPSGWFMFKSDDYMGRMIFSLVSEYFEYLSKSIIWDKGSIGIGMWVRPQHELIELYRPLNHKNTYLWNKPNLQAYTKAPFYKMEKFMNPSLNPEDRITKIRIDPREHEGKGIAFPTILKIKSLNQGNYAMKNKHQDHINSTPIELWLKILKWFCPVGGSLIDFTAGSGTIEVAAKILDLNALGSEIDPIYYKIAIENLTKVGTKDYWKEMKIFQQKKKKMF